MNNILVGSYTEKGYEPVPLARLTEKEYTRGLQCYVPACTDIVPVDIKRKLIYLTRRQIKPMKGWWWIGGKMNPDDTIEVSLIRSLKRETGLSLPIERFRFVGIQDYRWKDREQFPQDVGCHMLSLVHTVELTEVENIFVSTHLDETFEKGVSLVPFDRQRIKEEIAKGETISAVLDLYDFIFP